MIIRTSYSSDDRTRTLRSSQRRADGTWGPARTVSRDVHRSIVDLDVASDGRGALAVRTIDRSRDPVVLHKPDGGAWQRAPELLTERESPDRLMVDGDRVTTVEPRYDDEADGFTVEVHDWTAGEDAWTVQTLAEVERFWSLAAGQGRRGTVVAWSDTGVEPPVVEVATRPAGEQSFELPSTVPGLSAADVEIDDRGVVHALGVEASLASPVVVRRDPDDGSWSTQVLDERPPGLSSSFVRLDLHRSGSLLATHLAASGDDTTRHLVACTRDRTCGEPEAYGPMLRLQGYDTVAGPRGAAAFVWNEGKGCEACLIRDLWARTLRPAV